MFIPLYLCALSISYEGIDYYLPCEWSAIFVLPPEKHQHMVAGLSHPSGACSSAGEDGQGGGSWSKDGHGCGKGREKLT